MSSVDNPLKIAIIGGSYLQLPVVLKAKAMGIETHCFAWKDAAVCEQYADFFYPISIVEKERIAQKCRQIGIDGVITIASDVAVITVNYIADKMGLIANPIEHTGIVTNKYLMREAFKLHNIPSPAYRIIRSVENSKIEDVELPVIVKPTDRSGSRGVMLVKSPQQIESAIARAYQESFAGEAIIEEYVEGREISVESISFRGIHYILQITDKITTGAPYFVELEHHQPSTLAQGIQENVRRIVLKALDALQIQNGASHSELKITPTGDIKVIEIGSRMGGDFIGSDLVELSTGYDFLKGVIEVALGIFKVPVTTQRKYSGVYFLSQETSRLLPIFRDKVCPEILKQEVTDPILRDVKCSADRSGYLIYQSDHKIIL